MYDQENYKLAYKNKDFKELKRIVTEEKGISINYDAILLLIKDYIKERNDD